MTHFGNPYTEANYHELWIEECRQWIAVAVASELRGQKGAGPIEYWKNRLEQHEKDRAAALERTKGDGK